MQIRQIKNGHLLKSEEIRMIEAKVVEMLGKYNVPVDCLKFIEISRRLKTTAGKIYYYENHGRKTFDIRLAYNNYQKFGFQRTMGTLIHELAHAVAYYAYNHSGHGETFKKICHENGGTMNSQQAGTRYASSATSDFCTTPYRYVYRCECGQAYRRKGKFRKVYNKSCTKCGTLVAYMQLIKL
jgi:predicted SprT family Zn-dependent metalloprotease